MAVTHTPGPWFASGCDVKPLGDRPIICWTGAPERAIDEARANARLIAAAPDLLAAAPDLLAVLRSLHDVYDSHMAALPPGLQTAVRDVIAKAEGHS